jgi:nitroreductase
MDGLEMLYTRRSIRLFKEDPIDDDTLHKIIKAGKLAATARNVQPCEMVLVKSKELLHKLSEIAETGRFIKHAAACILLFARDTKYYLEDGSAAAQNMLLAARYFRIASCWVAGDKKPYTEEIRELCKMSREHKLICLIALGYPLNESEFKEKRVFNEGYKVM